MHANKGSRRYRYYVEESGASARIESASEQVPGIESREPDVASNATPTRLPAHEIEIAVLEALRNGLEDRRELPARLGDIAPDQIPGVFASSARLADTFAKRIGAKQIEVFRGVVKRVVYSRDAVALELSGKGLRKAMGLPAQRPWQDGREANFDASDEGNFTVKIPVIYRRRGVQMKLMIPGSQRTVPPDQPLITAIARAHDWADRIMTGQCETMAEIAEQEGLSFQYVSQVMPLAFLAPSIVERILVGDHPPGLTADGLIWREALPVRWGEQEQRLTN
jgi:site-specific DNA recombinase